MSVDDLPKPRHWCTRDINTLREEQAMKIELPNTKPASIDLPKPRGRQGMRATQKDIDALKEEIVAMAVAGLPNTHEVAVRIEALKLANEVALKINHFENHYATGKQGLLADVDIVHEIAERNFNYIMRGLVHPVWEK